MSLQDSDTVYMPCVFMSLIGRECLGWRALFMLIHDSARDVWPYLFISLHDREHL